MNRQHHATADGTVEFTDAEQAQYETLNVPAAVAATQAANAKAAQAAAILVALAAIDQKKVRAITDAVLAGDKTRLAALEAEAEALRAQLL